MRPLSKKEVCFVILSIFIHLLLLLAVVRFLYNNNIKKDSLVEMEINLIEEPVAKLKIQDSVVKLDNVIKSLPKSKSKSFSLKKLMPKTGFVKEDIFENAKEAERLSNEIVVEDLSFYKEIWKRIDAKFYYPDVFNSLFLSGGAFVDVYVKRDGSLSRYILNVKGSNEHMEAFVKSLVVSALRDPLHKPLWHPENKEIKLGLNFELEMMTVPQAIDHYSKGRVNRREMHFYRKVVNPKAHIVSKTLPFLGGSGMLDVVYVFNALSGRLKEIYKRNMVKLEKLKKENEKIYNQKRD